MRRECPEWDVPPEYIQAQRIGDLLLYDPAIQAILNSAAGVPGTPPGQGEVGETLVITGQAAIPPFSISPPWDTLIACNPSLPAGDWFLWPSATWNRVYPGVYCRMNAPPLVFTTDFALGFWGGQYPSAGGASGVPCHALLDSARGLVFDLNINPGAATIQNGTFNLTVRALRLR